MAKKKKLGFKSNKKKCGVCGKTVQKHVRNCPICGYEFGLQW